jgi:hypothetical protein
VGINTSRTTKRVATMSSGPSDSKLLVTAVGAALSGAALGVAAIKLWEKKYKPGPPFNATAPYRLKPVFYKEELDDSTSSLLFPHNHEEKMRRRIAARTIVEEDNFQPRDSVTVRVPASSANMGPGCMYWKGLVAACLGAFLWRWRNKDLARCSILCRFLLLTSIFPFVDLFF